MEDSPGLPGPDRPLGSDPGMATGGSTPPRAAHLGSTYPRAPGAEMAPLGAGAALDGAPHPGAAMEQRAAGDSKLSTTKVIHVEPNFDFPSTLPRQMKWLPDGMDPSSTCRVVIKVPAYVELPCEEYHVSENFRFVVDKDTTNWIDFSADLEAKIKHSKEQELHVYFLDKNTHESVRIESDSALMKAFSQYWDKRMLSLEGIVHDIEEIGSVVAVVPCTPSLVAAVPPSPIQPSTTNLEEEDEEEPVDELELLGPNYVPEYVGVDYERIYLGDNGDNPSSKG